MPLQFESAVNLREAEAGPSLVRSANATAALREGRLKDVALVGEKLFNDYNLHLQMVAVLILIATVGVVALGKKDRPREADDIPATGSEGGSGGEAGGGAADPAA